MNLIKCFERAYIVNLPERADRRREMFEELGRAGLRDNAERIRCFRAVRPDDAGAFPSRGARGCFLSHLGIIEEALRDGLGNVLIMEDDLRLDPRVRDAPPAMCDRLESSEWHFAYLGHVESPPPANPPHWLETKQPLATTHCYALHGSVLARVRDHLVACLQRPSGHVLGSPMHIDGAYSLFRQFNPDVITLLAAPSLGGQRSSRSDIYPNKWYDRLPLTRTLAGLARGIKNRHAAALS